MGNLCTSNEITFEDRLREQLCQIVEQYDKLELTCGYIGIFEMVLGGQIAQSHANTPNNHHLNGNVGYPGTKSNTPNNGYYNGNHNNVNTTSFPYNNHNDDAAIIYGGGSEENLYDDDEDEIKYNRQTIDDFSDNLDEEEPNGHHQNSSSTRSNLKVKSKKEIQIICDLDYGQFNQWKIDQVLKANPNISDEELKKTYNLVKSNTSTNNIFQSRMISNSPLIQVFTSNEDDEKQRLLMSQKKPSDNSLQNPPSGPIINDNIHDIRNILDSNDIRASIQSLGDTTDQLCEILGRAKILHKMKDDLSKKIIHIRGHQQTIFSYYLLKSKYIIISYSQSKSGSLSFIEWIKIQSKLEKIEITLKDIEILLDDEEKFGK